MINYIKYKKRNSEKEKNRD